jgi:O-methyltransferase/8-demethyl-8-(2,3-dimethoxy-alpha-L-rhamnosyl)tetracenomycin-C 4'-O-methyltransferase
MINVLLNSRSSEDMNQMQAREAHLRHLYLELLIKILLNVIYDDPSIDPHDPGETSLFEPKARLEGRDWPTTAHTMAGFQRINNVRDLAQRAIDEGIYGDFIEAGVWRGGCCILMRGVLAANDIRNRKVYVADSFAGLPPPRPEMFPYDDGLDLHLYSQLSVPLGDVKANFARYGLLDDQVVFVEGLFQDTLPSLTAGPFALLRLDGDLYESTYVALEALYPKLSPGGFVIIDDYGALRACQMAVTDYRMAMGIEEPIYTIDWSGVWWQKANHPI